MSLRKRSILIADADAFLAGLYARRFEARQWHVRVAETDADAQAVVQRKSFDAVLIDVETLPGAWDLLATLRRQPKTAGTMVLVLTALSDRESIQRAREAGADGYLLKGHFVPSEVEEKVERLVASRQETI